MVYNFLVTFDVFDGLKMVYEQLKPATVLII